MSKRKIHKSKFGIIDFQKKFNTEDKCREFLFELRFPQGFVCQERVCSASYLSQTLKLPYKTAWFLLQRLRSAMSNRENKYLLDGIVELDDTYIGTSDHGKKRGRGTTKMKIMVAVSKTINGAPKYVK